ncbi:MAG: histidine phosphatase family protein [Anaerolineaceae bacterium]|jgi:2,3-bisphosphoglycerate-dependent phosphoglycerate mutase
MQIYFIRHAQSLNNAIWEKDHYTENTRVADPPLTQKGIEQAKILADFLAKTDPNYITQYGEGWDPQNRAGFGLTHLYTSLMERAVHTGSIIADKLDLPLYGGHDFHEVGGIYLEVIENDIPTIQIVHGRNLDFFNANFPRLIPLREVEERGWWAGGKEEKSSRMPRAQRVIQLLKERHSGTDDRVGVITHGGFFRYLFRALFQLDLDDPEDQRLRYNLNFNNCGITRIDFEGDQFTMMYQNRLDYLPSDLVT